MKLILCLPLLCLFALRAEDSADREAIRDAIAALNRSGGLEPWLGPARGPWSEVTRPRLVCWSIRVLSPELAIVEGTLRQYGSVILVRNIPVALALRKQGTSWSVVWLRVVAGCLHTVQPAEYNALETPCGP